jgi:mRNA interferase HigB
VLILRLASIESFLKRTPPARAPMARWIDIADAAAWRNIVQVRASLPHADAIKGTNLTCFNIGGGKYRLLTVISFDRQEILIRELITHAEYDRKYT